MLKNKFRRPRFFVTPYHLVIRLLPSTGIHLELQDARAEELSPHTSKNHFQEITQTKLKIELPQSTGDIFTVVSPKFFSVFNHILWTQLLGEELLLS